MAKSKWLEDITLKDIKNNDLKMVAECCGLDVAVSLIENMRGMGIYIPKNADMELKKRYVRQHYDGHNVNEMVRDLDVSREFVFSVMREAKKVNLSKQTTLF